MIQWITASTFKYLNDNKQNYQLHVEGEAFNIETTIEWAEANISDIRPYRYPGSSKYELDLHIMCSSKNLSTMYDVQKMADFFINLIQPFNVYKYGDDNSLIGCMRPRTDLDSPIDVIPWGLVQLSDGPTRVFQISVHGFFQMDL